MARDITTEEAREELISPEEFSYWKMVWKRLKKHKLAMVGMYMLIIIIIICLIGPLIYRVDPNYQIEGPYELLSPGAVDPNGVRHPLGTDDFARDVLARLLYGGRISLLIGFSASISAALVGAVVGLIAGYYGKTVDNILMRITDIFLCLPTIPLLIALASVIGKGILQLIFVIVVFGWMTDARLVRGIILSLKEQEFTEAARAIGVPPSRIMFKHLLPNTLAYIIIGTTLGIGSSIIYEASISFLGFGVQAPTASWGNMLQGAQNYIWRAPFLVFYPGILIFITVLAFNFFGDGLRDALDPRLKI
ncbi:ABC transporter permease [bacterium]|nr:ABC transporter permease [bacterium]